MPYIDKTFDFEYGSDNKYEIDLYQTNSHLSSLEINRNGNIQMKNFSDDPKSDNFYGDGRLGRHQQINTTEINPRTGYVQEVQNHPVYGWCLYRTWYQTSEFLAGDEIVIYKKHIESEAYLDQLGTWEVLTIKEKIVDSFGTHYSLEKAPVYEYTSNTANSISLILQYEYLKILDNQRFAIDLHAASYVTMPSDLWLGRRISHPQCILYIKSQEGIEIGKNAYIGSLFGYNGAHAYYNLYSTNQSYSYSDGGAPLGCGTDSRSGNYLSLVASIRDIRSSGINRLGIGYVSNVHDNNTVYGPGGCGSNGIRHDSNTFFGNSMPVSLNLNNRIYCGLGGTQFYFGYDNNSYYDDAYQSNHGYGYAGGGILIIQTPKIEFKDKESRLYSTGTGNSTRRRLGYGSGGSMIIKAEELIFNENPGLKVASEDFSTILGNSTSSFSTVNGLNASYSNYISPPGQIQLEFDRWVNNYELDSVTGEPTVYTPSTVSTTVLEDHIYDFYSTKRKQSLGLLGTVEEWSTDGLQQYKSHDFSSPKYETGKFYKFVTRGLGNINIEMWSEITSLSTNSNIPEGTEIKLAFSTNLGSTWQYINLDGPAPQLASLTLSDADLNTKGNTPEQLKEFVSSAFLTNMFIYSQRTEEIKTIDVCIALKTTKSHITPMFDRLWFNYEGVAYLNPPIPMSPYNGEEFNNEYVNFVWLQPESRDGSIQNRIEINIIPSFERPEISIIADNEDNSSSNGKIHLPYKPMLFDNTNNNCNYFKLPYMKRRYSNIVNANEINLASLLYDTSTRTINYIGKDIFFRKGNTIELSPGNIQAPSLSSMNFRLDNITIPKASNFQHHFKFYNLPDTSYNTLKDAINPSMFDPSKIEVGTYSTTNNILHGKTIDFNKSGSSYFKIGLLANSGSGLGTKDTNYTFSVRFVPDGLTVASENYISGVWNVTRGYWSWLISLYPYVDIDGETKVRIGYYIYNAWYYYHAKGILEKTENVITVTTSDTSTANDLTNIYLNGIKIINEVPARNSGIVNTDIFYLCVGSDQNITNNTLKFVGQIIEIGCWNTVLSDSEILQISKVPTYHLRYDFNTNSLVWKQVPYKDHLLDYKFVQDNVDVFNATSDTTRYCITNQHFAFNDAECYYTNHNSALFGIYSPNVSESTSFKQFENSFKPINGIPFLYNREGDDRRAYKTRLRYHDSNTFRQTGNFSAQWQHVSPHSRIEANTDSVVLSFVFREYANLSYTTPIIGIVTGTLNYSEVVDDDTMYSRRFLLKYDYISKSFKFLSQILHTNSTRYTVHNWVTLSYPLKDNHVYNMEMRSNGNIKNTEVWITSPTDDNYLTGIRLYSPSDTTYTPMSYGYNTNDFKDITRLTSAIYEDVAATFMTGEENSFEIIGLSTYNDNSNIISYAGYEFRYDIYKSINKEGLQKLNYVEFKGGSTSAESDIRIFFSFNNGLSYKRFNFSTNVWNEVNPSVVSNGMTVEDVMKLSTYQFNLGGGFTTGNNVISRIVFSTTSPFSTSLMDYIKISYNGPMIIDSWQEGGSFYNGTQFYFSESGWNPYIPADFSDSSQNWVIMGTDKPSHSNWDSTKGSKGSFGPRKVFAGCRVLLNPKGKYYWRVAAYNGL